MQSTLTSFMGHKKGRKGKWTDKWKSSNVFNFKGDHMAKGNDFIKITFIKIAINYLGKISKRNMKIALYSKFHISA